MTAPGGRETSVGILDTNAVILFGDLDPSELPEHPVITTVTLAELSVGPLATKDPAEQAVRQARLQLVEATFDPLPFDAASARAFGSVAAGLRRAGRKSGARTYDAMIAATAIANALPLYTANPRDFAGIDGLDVHPLTSPAT